MASSLPDNNKRPKQMAHEGFEILLAGSDTDARTMDIAAYQAEIARRARSHNTSPRRSSRFKRARSSTIPKSGDKRTDHRLSLVAPHENLQYGPRTIPAGACISMTPTRNAYDERFFPSPTKFTPDRWLLPKDKVARMNRVFMPFAHGRRGCLGMHFAFAELRAGMACLFRRFDFELVDTVRERGY
ncbi:cytochrome P450 [Aspergillus varians]